MNTQSNDVVKTVDLNSNEQQKAVKPIIVSRRRLLRAGVSGIPVMLTMAGVAPGEGIKGIQSAASGLVYGGDGVGVRKRFNGTDKVAADNLVWSNKNGFVINKSENTIFTQEIEVTAVDPSKTASFKISKQKSGESVSSDVTVTVSPKVVNSTNSNVLKFNAFLHKSGIYYSDFYESSTDPAKSLDEYFTTSNISNFFTSDDTTLGGIPFNSTYYRINSVTVESVTSSRVSSKGYNLYDSSGDDIYYYVATTSTSYSDLVIKLSVVFYRENKTVTVGEYTYTFQDEPFTLSLELDYTVGTAAFSN